MAGRDVSCRGASASSDSPRCRNGWAASRRGCLFACLAIERLAETTGASLRREHPWPAHERRVVTNVLPVPAGQVGHPIAMLVLMKPNDGLSHRALVGASTCPSLSRQTFQDQRQSTDR